MVPSVTSATLRCPYSAHPVCPQTHHAGGLPPLSHPRLPENARAAARSPTMMLPAPQRTLDSLPLGHGPVTVAGSSLGPALCSRVGPERVGQKPGPASPRGGALLALSPQEPCDPRLCDIRAEPAPGNGCVRVGPGQRPCAGGIGRRDRWLALSSPRTPRHVNLDLLPNLIFEPVFSK